jgi:hypothetical protein
MEKTMRGLRAVRRWLAEPLALLMIVLALPMGAAQGAMVSTTAVIDKSATVQGSPEEARERVLAFVQREDVRAEMKQLGVDPDEAAARTAALSDREIAMIDGRISELPAGEGILVTLGIVVGVVFLVLVLTDLLCLTRVFGFVRCQR